MRPSVGTPSLAADFARQGYEVEETHISWVFLGPGGAYKVKKPVEFGYLDFSSPEKRRAACEREVELNRRLSPEIYLGVIPVTKDASEVHRLGGDGPVVDWAVHMVRLPAGWRGDRRLEGGTLSAGHLEVLAERLAAFHAAAAPDERASAYGDPAAVRANLEENFAESRPAMRAVLGLVGARSLEEGLRDAWAGKFPVMRERGEAGRVRDGHGDLRLSQVYFDGNGKAVILDCIEFNDRFRFGDVASDVAFLAMDLAVRGRADLSEIFLAAYARASGDYGLYALVDFFAAYRACVRGKIAGYAMGDPAAGCEVRLAATKKARTYFTFARSRILAPVSGGSLIAFGGLPGTGKSTLATALGRRLCLPVLDSDRLRKRMAGLDPLTRRADKAFQGLYASEFSDKVYAEMRRGAEAVLASGRSVIVDATFRARKERDAFRALAARMGVPFHFFECRADPLLTDARLRRRESEASVSDGRREIAEELRASWEDGEEADAGAVLDTAESVERCLSRVRQRILGLRGSTGEGGGDARIAVVRDS